MSSAPRNSVTLLVQCPPFWTDLGPIAGCRTLTRVKVPVVENTLQPSTGAGGSAGDHCDGLQGAPESSGRSRGWAPPAAPASPLFMRPKGGC